MTNYFDSNNMSLEGGLYKHTSNGFIYILAERKSMFEEIWHGIAVLSGKSVRITPPLSHFFQPITRENALSLLEQDPLENSGYVIDETVRLRVHKSMGHSRAVLDKILG